MSRMGRAMLAVIATLSVVVVIEIVCASMACACAYGEGAGWTCATVGFSIVGVFLALTLRALSRADESQGLGE